MSTLLERLRLPGLKLRLSARQMVIGFVQDVRRMPFRALGTAIVPLVFGYWLGVRSGVLWFIFMLFAVFGWDVRSLGMVALLSLGACPIMLHFRQDAWAERAAVWAFYFLVMIVGLQALELWVHRKQFDPEPE